MTHTATTSTAHSSNALGEILRVYQHRHSAPKELHHGAKPIGCLGGDAPEELICAAGFVPVRIFGSGAVMTKTADQYLENGFDPLVRAQFEQIVNGAYTELDRIVITNSSDALIRVYYYLRAMRVKEPERSVPEPYFIDFLHSRHRMCGLYNRERYQAFLAALEQWSGKPVTPEDIRASIATLNETRQLMARLAELRRQPNPRISGLQALQISGAAMVMPKAAFNALLGRVLEDAHTFPQKEGVRLFVTGSPVDDPALYEAVEACGAVIVGEDHETGERQFEGLVREADDPLDAIVERYHDRQPGSTQATVSDRVRDLLHRVRQSGAQGVVAYIRQSDDAPSWDFPEQKKALEAAGIPVLLLDRQPYSVSDALAVQQQVELFLKSIAGGTA